MMSHLKIRFFMATLTVLAALAVGAQEGDPSAATRSVQEGVYTVEQAERGGKVFEEQCLECHAPEEFIGGYMDGWSGRTAHDLVESIRQTMPENNPGGLKRQEFVDIVAYLFKINAVPAGEDKMDAKTAKQIRIEGPFGGAMEDSESREAEPPYRRDKR